MASPRFHSVRSPQGSGRQRRSTGDAGRPASAGPRWQRGRRGDRHQRGDRRHRPHLCGMGGDLFALVHRDGEVFALELQRTCRLRRRRRGAARRGPHRDAVPPRHPLGHGARLRRRLDRAARAVRHAAAVGRCCSRPSSSRPTASPRARCWSAPAARADEGASENLAELISQLTRPGARVARPGVGPGADRNRRRRTRRVLPGRVRRGAEGVGCRALQRRRPRPTACRVGDTADGARVRRRPVDAPAELAGLPHARLRPSWPAGSTCRPTPTTFASRTC